MSERAEGTAWNRHASHKIPGRIDLVDAVCTLQIQISHPCNNGTSYTQVLQWR